MGGMTGRDASGAQGAGAGEDVVGVADLYAQTLGACIVALLVLSGLVLAIAAFGLNSVDATTASLAGGLAGVALLARRLAQQDRQRQAVLAIVLGLCLVYVAMLEVLPAEAVAPWMSLVVLVASVLVGWRAGVVVGGGLALCVTALEHLQAGLIAGQDALGAVLLSAAAVFLAWATTRPTRTALDCASRCYTEAQQAVETLRDRQAELARFGKSLSVSYHLLQQLNLELDHARKAAQEARQLKAQFAAAVSHELRTPLNLIIGFCEMMVLSPAQAYGRRLPSGFKDDVEAIYRNACHLSALVDDILDLSQVDADRMALQREWLSLPEVVEEAMAPLASLFRDRGLYLRSDIARDVPPVFADRTRIRQILINLLNNAARFTDRGGVTIGVRTERTSGVAVAVSDTGPGIAPDDLRYVFQEFHQFGDPRRRRGGSGLGLAVSKAFAELHQGSLAVESTFGEGSTFILRLPVGADAALERPASEPVNNRVRPGVRGQRERRVLVVDRSGQLMRVFRRYLDGYRLLQLRDLKAARAEDPVLLPHAVIVGCAEDRERWRRAAAALPNWQRVPVLVCPLKTAQRQADELGVRDYLVKPVTRAQLRGSLKRVCPAPGRVLVVEDDPGMQRLLARMTRSLATETQVAVASSGSEALEHLRAAPVPDLILLDLLLPDLDGYGVLEALRLDARLREVPVIVVSARGSHSEAMLANELAVACESGLTVAEVMRWVTTGVEALFAPAGASARAVPARPGA